MELQYVLAFAIVIMGAAVSGMAAFGFSLIIVPPLLLVFDPVTTTTMVIVVTLVTRWLVLFDAWSSIRWSAVAVMAPPGFIGSFVGAWVLSEVKESYIKLLASVVVIISAVFLLSGRRIPGANGRVSGPLAGFASGFLNTATGMAGPPAVLLFSAREYATQVFRGSLAAFFYLVSVTGLIALINQDLVGKREMTVAVAMLPAGLVGTWAGQKLTRHFSPQTFRRIVLILLIISGVIGAAAAVRQLL